MPHHKHLYRMATNAHPHCIMGPSKRKEWEPHQEGRFPRRIQLLPSTNIKLSADLRSTCEAAKHVSTQSPWLVRIPKAIFTSSMTPPTPWLASSIVALTVALLGRLLSPLCACLFQWLYYWYFSAGIGERRERDRHDY